MATPRGRAAAFPIDRRPTPGAALVRQALLSLALLSLALGASVLPSPALAQGAGPAPSSAAEPRRSYQLPSGTLSQVLTRFAGAAGVELAIDTSLIAGRHSAGLNGEYTVKEGFAQLLGGQDLRVVREANGNYTVVRASPAGAGVATGPGVAAEAVLPSVTVRGSTPPSEGALPMPYAGGQIATGGRVGLLGNKDLLETPFATTNYTSEFIQDRQATDLTQVISRSDPAVFNGGATGMINDTWTVRGLNISNSDVAIDGLYGMAPYWRMATEMVERVEVHKGPAALLNGMPPGGSVGGSINVVMKRAGEQPLTRVTGSFQSDGLPGLHLDLGRRFGDGQFGIRFNGVFRKGDTAVDNQEKDSRLLSLGLDWRTDRARLSLDLYTSKDRVDGVNRGVSLAAGLAVPTPPRPETLLNQPWTFSDTEDRAAIARAEVDLSDKVSAWFAAGVMRTKFDALAASTYQVINAAGDFSNNVSHQRSEFRRQTADIGVRGELRVAGIRHEWAVNATHYEHDNDFGFQRNMQATPWVTNIYAPVWGPSVDTSFSHQSLSRTGALRTSSIGIADTMSFIDDRLQLTLSVRRQQVLSDTFSATTGERTARYDAGATTPTAALLFRATRHLSFYGNYIEGLSQGATAPTTADNAGEIFPPYKTKQKELGLKFDVGEFAHTLSLFEILRPSSYTDPVSNVFDFGGEQRNRGLEWQFFGTIARDLRLIGGVGYLQPKLTRTAGGVNQGRTATAVPRWQGKLGMEWDLPAVAGLTVGANAVTVSSQYLNASNEQSIPGRTIFDLAARYRTDISDLPVTVRATVTNVTNKAYWASSLSQGLGAPRTFLLSASVDF